MDTRNITIAPLTEDDREQFILDNQEAFRFGAMEEFGMRDDHMEEAGEIISRKTIETSIDGDGAEALRIYENGKPVGGAVVKINSITQRNELELLFITPHEHSKGVGFCAWQLIEQRYPNTVVWVTCTPYFETRNIHFYINKCGFHAVEFFNCKHPDPNDPEIGKPAEYNGEDGFDGMFRFEKWMK